MSSNGTEVQQAAVQRGEQTPKRQHLKQFHWKPGQSGNPKGRPKGARVKLADRFLKDLQADWKVNGKDVIQKVREKHPDQYLKIVASIVPKDYRVDVSGDNLPMLIVDLRGADADEHEYAQVDFLEGETE